MSEGVGASLVTGQIVYDHLARRLARVEQVRESCVDLVDERTGLRWTADGLYPLGLEPLERPHHLILVYEHPSRAECHARFKALPLLEQVIAACRGLRTGPSRRPRSGPGDLSEPLTEDEVRRELEAASGSPTGPILDPLRTALRSAPDDGRLVIDRSGLLRVRLAEVGWLVDRVTAGEARPRLRRGAVGEFEVWLPPPLVPPGASASSPHAEHEEAALLWALREVVRIEGTATRGDVDDHRLGALRPRLWAVFRPGVERHLDRRTDAERPWTDREAAPDEVFDLLLQYLRGAPDRPRNVTALTELLAGTSAAECPPSQAIHRALFDCHDALRPDATLPVPPPGSFNPDLDDRPGTQRPGASLESEPGFRELGFKELRRIVVSEHPRADEGVRMTRMRELLEEVRVAFLRGVDGLQTKRPDQYRALLLEFLSLLDRQRIADVAGINYNTLRGWYPRSGEREATRSVPAFVRALVPSSLHASLQRFGQVFPAMRAGLLPRQDEIDALVDDEDVRVGLSALFVHEDLDGRGDFWPDGTLARVARDLGMSELELIEQRLLPFLERLIAHRRARDLDRGVVPPWLQLVTGRDAEQLALAGLALLLLGAPDGDALGRLLAARTNGDIEARRRLAAEAGLENMDLVDLELGLRWATPAELEGLRRALGPDAGPALDGLRPKSPPGSDQEVA